MGYDLPQPERKHFASSCFCVNNSVGAGIGAGAGAGGEVLGTCPLDLPWLLYRGSPPPRAVGSSFGVDALSDFFFFWETTSFHSPGGERSVLVSKSVTVVRVLGLASGGALLSSMVGDGVRHTASLNEAANLDGVGAAILESAILSMSSSSMVAELFLLVVFLFGILRGSCQVISNLTICFPSVNRQIRLPAIGNLLIASAQTSGTSIVSISQVKLSLIKVGFKGVKII